SIDVVGWVEDPETYPLAPKQHSFEHLRKVAHLRPRTNTFGAVARLRHSLSFAIHKYFHEHGFFWIHTPMITSSDAEGAGQAFADINDNAALPEDFLKSIIRHVLDERGDDFGFFTKQIDPLCVERAEKLVATGFERMTYTEAIERLEKAKKKFEFPVHWGMDLQAEHERYICEEVVRGPVVLMH